MAADPDTCPHAERVDITTARDLMVHELCSCGAEIVTSRPGTTNLDGADQADDLDPQFAAASAVLESGRIIGGAVDAAVDAERAAIVAWLRAEFSKHTDGWEIAGMIERGEHLAAGDE